MSFIFALAIYTFLLFALSYFSRRNVGMPALGLTAGAVLANVWTTRAAEQLQNEGIATGGVPVSSAVAITLTLLPALVVMVKSSKAHSKLHRAYSSVVFSLLATTLTYMAFVSSFKLDDASRQIVLGILPYDSLIITICIIIALVDVLYHQKRKAGGAHKKKD